MSRAQKLVTALVVIATLAGSTKKAYADHTECRGKVCHTFHDPTGSLADWGSLAFAGGVICIWMGCLGNLWSAQQPSRGSVAPIPLHDNGGNEFVRPAPSVQGDVHGNLPSDVQGNGW